MSPPPRLRIAPTPSGLLHLGNGVNFALTAALADALGAELRLRVDDLDAARVRPAYLTDIAATLRWLLPERANELLDGAAYQSKRRERYTAVLEDLRQNGELFACACTRREIRAAQSAAAGREGGGDVNAYPGTCLGQALGLDRPDVAWRLRPRPGSLSATVLRQRDGTPAYQLASLIDDVEFGITHLVRGADLRSSTDLQRQLARVLAANGTQAYAAFAQVRAWHHPLVTDADGRKLSKSAGATSLAALRATPDGQARVFAEAGRLIGGADCSDLTSLTEVLRENLLAGGLALDPVDPAAPEIRKPSS